MHRIGRLLGLLSLAGAWSAAVKLPAPISDHMVLQRGLPVRIWGTADPGENIKVDFQGQSATARAGENGKWTVWLRPLVAAGPLEMTIDGAVIKDVLPASPFRSDRPHYQ
jgi:sialate O-acetylesterase